MAERWVVLDVEKGAGTESEGCASCRPKGGSWERGGGMTSVIWGFISGMPAGSDTGSDSSSPLALGVRPYAFGFTPVACDVL